MNGIIKTETIHRLEKITGQPISRGVDKSINICLDKLEHSLGIQN